MNFGTGINVVLLIQAINFVIAYWCIRLLAFKPAVRVLQEQQNQRDNLNKSSDNLLHANQEIKETIEKKRLACTQTLTTIIPKAQQAEEITHEPFPLKQLNIQEYSPEHTQKSIQAIIPDLQEILSNVR